MQILRDTGALAIIILLALTVRIEADGAPLDVDLATPVEAASLESPEFEQAEAEVVDDVEHELRFVSLRELSSASAELSQLAEPGRDSSECTAEQTSRTIIIRRQLEDLPQLLQEAQRIALDGTWRLNMVPATMTAPEPAEDPAPCPCEASINPGLSC